MTGASETQSGAARTGAQHKLDTVDCLRPLKVTAFAAPACENKGSRDNLETAKQERWHILQQVSSYNFQAIKCTKRITRMIASCGVCGHVKILLVPETHRRRSVSRQDCLKTFGARRVQADDGVFHEVKIGQEMYFKQVIQGTLTVSDGVARCRGQQSIYQGKAVDELLILEDVTLEVKLVDCKQDFEDNTIRIIPD